MWPRALLQVVAALGGSLGRQRRGVAAGVDRSKPYAIVYICPGAGCFLINMSKIKQVELMFELVPVLFRAIKAAIMLKK